jgi:hypothetical protein
MEALTAVISIGLTNLFGSLREDRRAIDDRTFEKFR